MYHNANRAVVHMDLDTFFVSVERMQDARLEGIPLIIGGSSGRGVVASCSYEARKFGVRSAMPMRMAKRLCPQAKVISGDMELYSRYSQTVTEIVKEKAPLYEKASIDEFYIDLSGMERFFGAFQWAGELRQTISKETGLPLSFGLAVNKTVAKVATNEIKPAGQLRIFEGEEQPFLDPLSVGKIPGVGQKTSTFLNNLGVRRIRGLRDIPREYLGRILGKSGYTLYQRARGVDPNPVVPYSERKSISTERTFQQDTIDVRRLKAMIAGMAEKLAFQLREKQQLCACITVKIRYSNFDTETRQMRIPYTASDHLLSKKALELFEKLYQRRMLIRLVGVRLSHLIRGGYQVDLFDDTEKQISLYEAIDRIKFKYGAKAIMRGEAFHTRKKDMRR